MSISNKSIEDLLYDYACHIDTQTEARKGLEYSEITLKRARKKYSEITSKVEEIKNEIIRRTK